MANTAISSGLDGMGTVKNAAIAASGQAKSWDVEWEGRI
jgi:hypothetical protein